jgi:hypothetical protein
LPGNCQAKRRYLNVRFSSIDVCHVAKTWQALLSLANTIFLLSDTAPQTLLEFRIGFTPQDRQVLADLLQEGGMG